MPRVSGSRLWLASLARVSGSRLWLASLARVFGSRLWLASLARVFGSRHIIETRASRLYENQTLQGSVETRSIASLRKTVTILDFQ